MGDKVNYLKSEALTNLVDLYRKDEVYKKYFPKDHEKEVREFDERRATFRELSFQTGLGEYLETEMMKNTMESVSTTNRILNLYLPDPETVDKRLKKLNQVMSTLDPEKDKDKIQEIKRSMKQYNKLKQLPDTAFATKVYSSNMGGLVFFIGVSDHLFSDLLKKYEGDENKVAKALATVIAHETDHILTGDLDQNQWTTGGKDKKNLGPGDRNVLSDSRINSTLLRYGYEDSKHLLDLMGIRGSTIPQYLMSPVLVEAMARLKEEKGNPTSKEEYLKHLASVAGEYNIPNENVTQIMHQIDEKWLKELSNNLDKAGNPKDFMRDIFEKHNKSLKKLKEAGSIPVSEKVINSFDRYEHVIDIMKSNMESFEKGEDHILLTNLWADLLDRTNSLLPKPSGQGEGEGEGQGQGQGGGQGQGEGEGEGKHQKKGKGQPTGKQPMEKGFEPDDVFDPDDYIPIPKRKAWSEESDLRDILDEINERRGGNFASPTGSASLGVELKPPGISEKLKKAIKNILKLMSSSLQPQIQEELYPIWQPWALPAHIEATEGNLEEFPPPIGVDIQAVEKTPFKGVVFTVFDESGSVSDEELAMAKEVMTQVCKSENLILVGVSQSAESTSADFTIYNKNKPETKKDFMKRFKTGGTARFHEHIFDFDELSKLKGYRKRLDEALKKGGVKHYSEEGGKEEQTTVETLKKLWEQGKLVGLVFTDGELIPEEIDTDKYRKYAEKVGFPPITYISFRNPDVKPFNVSANLRKKLIDVYHIPTDKK